MGIKIQKPRTPKGFRVLTSIPGPSIFYYKIDHDGGVSITSPSSHPTECLFHGQLYDGSFIEGGWCEDLRVFGHRKTPSGNRPLRWCYWKIDSEEKMSYLSEKTVNLMEKWTEKQAKHGSRSVVQKILGNTAETEATLILAMKEDLERLAEETRIAKEELRVANQNEKKSKDLLDQLKRENEGFKKQAEEIRKEAIEEVKKIQNDYDRRSQVSRWQIEATASREARVEGLEARVWEIEDPNKELRYLVVATTPRGTEKDIEKQWVSELQKQLETRYGDSLYYLIVPPSVSISVSEVRPGVEHLDEEGGGQF